MFSYLRLPTDVAVAERQQRDLPLLASGDRDHILSGVLNQFLSEKSEPAE